MAKLVGTTLYTNRNPKTAQKQGSTILICSQDTFFLNLIYKPQKCSNINLKNKNKILKKTLLEQLYLN